MVILVRYQIVIRIIQTIIVGFAKTLTVIILQKIVHRESFCIMGQD